MATNTEEMPTDDGISRAASALKQAKEDGCGLMVLTGAGMSVSSKVPVFRNADGSMSAEFLAFLNDYNKARRQHGLFPVDDWFGFSVPEMFRSETAREAWAYWRWRILRACVEPGEDYRHLSRILEAFGPDKSFVVTSNCDGLHLDRQRNKSLDKAIGVEPSRLQEIHGSLSRVQCSKPCCNELWPVDDTFLARLKDEPDWVPMCPKCQTNCLRPNVMIFSDHTLVYTVLEEQHFNNAGFKFRHQNGKWIVLEIGAGVVVASIRSQAEKLAGAAQSHGLVRINPSQAECDEMEISSNELVANNKYFPVVATTTVALKPIADALEV